MAKLGSVTTKRKFERHYGKRKGDRVWGAVQGNVHRERVAKRTGWVWVRGHKRKDGAWVKGHYRER